MHHEPLIDSPAALDAALAALRGCSLLYLDTEFDAVRGGATLCLLQLSDGERIFLLDPLAVDLSPLREVLGAPDAEWVLHSGRQDVPLLCQLLRIPAPERIFDTQIAWALLSPEHGVALAYLEFLLLGIQPEKAHQTDDWKRRPLPPHLRSYAARDVAHLPALRACLAERLDARQRRFAVHPASREAVAPPPEPSAPLSLASFRNAWQLDPPSQAALLALIDWANGLSPAEAEELLPEGKILMAMAARRPATAEELGKMKGVPWRLAPRRGAEVVSLLRRAAAEAREGAFIPLSPLPYATHEDIWARARLELVRAHASRLLDIAPEVLLPARLLDRLRPRLVASGDLAPLLDHIEGFRRDLLAGVWNQAISAL